MTLSDRITAMYSRSASHLSDHEAKPESCVETRSCKIRFLPGLALPDYRPVHQPAFGARPTTSILKRTSITSARNPTTLPAALHNSDVRFLRELWASKILSDRRSRAVSKLQARVRGILQRKLHKLTMEANRAQVDQPEPEEEPTDTSSEAPSEYSDEVQRLEQKLALIDRQRREELEKIEVWRAEEMRRIREEEQLSYENSQQLSAQVKSNHRCIRVLRSERERILEEEKSLRKDMVEIREEQRLLLTDSVQLKERARSLQRCIDTETKRNEDWSKASMQYQEHIVNVQSMIDEREARTAMEECHKNLYGRTVLDLAQLIGSHEDAFDRQELERQMGSISSACNLLYAA